MEPYEKLGLFYLGRRHDSGGRAAAGDLVLYDSRDLLTHALCVGMTGSGKTGLCIALLEEAAIDGIPAIAIDPKGDLANLMLTFPGLSAAEFRPWINEEAAARRGVTPEAYASSQAEAWRNGLEEWGQSGERIERLRQAADFAVYTPGSEAGRPVSILGAFDAPSGEMLADGDLLAERITATTTSLLGLLGLQGDPLKSREHVLVATILDHTWRSGRSLDLASLIQAIQSPPVSRIGVLEVESFYPAKDRFELAAALNNLLASPGFAAWFAGEPLDPGRLFYTESGKPRIAIFYVAHLSDAERMFFVSLLFNQVLAWVRTRPGTTSLRALLYMDEIFGYIPPVAEPPSKKPLLTLLKQARAYGLGVVLATQNPVDLDYKALSNIGTWFIGRLQTERDRERLLDGLEGIVAGRAGGMNREKIGEVISALDKRVFFMHDVHEDAPVVFQSRWAMSYLCGPMTREQIKTLMAPEKTAERTEAPQEPPREPLSRAETHPAPASVSAPRTAPPAPPSPAASAAGRPAAPSASQRPVMPPGISEVFLPLRGAPAGGSVHYRAGVLGVARVHYAHPQSGQGHSETVSLWAPLEEDAEWIDWEKARPIDLDPEDLDKEPAPGAAFGPLPRRAASARSQADWKRAFSDFLYRTRRVELFRHPRLRLASEPGESERDFRVRLGDATREERDSEVEKLRKKYAPKLRALQDRIERAGLAVDREKEQAKHEKVQTAISLGATMLSAFFGRKTLGRSTVGRATTTARGVGRSARQAQDVEQAQTRLESLRQQLADLQAEFDAEVGRLGERLDPQADGLESLALKPRKTDIDLRLIALAWAPHGVSPGAALASLWE